MSNVFTLDSIKEETVRRFSPVIIDLGDGVTTELKGLLRLGEKDRDAVLSIIEDINDLELEDEDDEELTAEWSERVCDACAKLFKLLTKSPKKLLAQLDHEDPLIKANLHTAVLTRWAGSSQLGEAESSPS